MAEGIRKVDDNAASHRGTGKYMGHAIWSKKVVELFEAHGPALFKTKGVVRHEHVVPANDLARALLSHPAETTVDEMVELITKYSRVAIITVEEDSLLKRMMPKGWNHTDTSHDNIFVRYHNAGLFDSLVFFAET